MHRFIHIVTIGAALLAVFGACGDPAPASDPAAQEPEGQPTPEPDAAEPDAAEPEPQPDPQPEPQPEPEPEVFSDDPLEWAPGADGPFAVGFRVQDVTWTSPESGEPRTIKVNIWYPTLTTEGEPAVYLGVRAFTDEEVVVGAPPADPVYPAGYPVHAHSHGFQGFGGTSADLMRHFASHGWLAVAPDHTNNTLSDHRDPLPTAHYFHRPLDIRVALDTIEALPDGDPLAGKADTSRVLLSGHSFGAYTTWVTGGASLDLEVIRQRCESGDIPEGGCTEAELEILASDLSDARVVATLPMAGTLRTNFFGEQGHRDIKGPVFFMSGSEDKVGAEEQFALVDGIDLTWIELEGGCHQTFALGFCNTLDPQEGFTIVNTFALSFARHLILADDSPATLAILDGSAPVSDKVTTFERKRP